MKNLEKKGTVAGVIITLILTVLAAGYIITTTEAVVTEYQPLTSQAQEKYNSARQELCLQESGLSGAKLMDVANNVNIEADLNKLKEKRDMDCSEGF